MASKVVIVPSVFPRPVLWDAAEVKGTIIVEQAACFDQIEVMTCYRNDGRVKRAVIFYHGYTQDKFSNMQIVYNLARKGFYVVAPEVGGMGLEKRKSSCPCGACYKQHWGKLSV